MKKIAMIVFSYYPADPRPRREAEALIEDGILVDMICLKEHNELDMEVVNGVNIHRIPLQRNRAGKLSYILEYGIFILLAFYKLLILHLKHQYDIIHIHNMPDILVITGLIPKILGAKIVLDLHDPMPEVYMAKYKIGFAHPIIRLLIFFEKYSIKFADLVFTPNIAFRDLFVSRRCPKEKIYIVMNSPQEDIFCKKNTNSNVHMKTDCDQFVIMYHGTIVERHGLGTALKAINIIKSDIPGLVFHVYGDGDYVDQFLILIDEMKLGELVKYHGRVALETIAKAIEPIDVGIIPNERTVFTEINLPTRIFEYLSMGKPVIAPRTKGIMDYFEDKSIFFFEPGDPVSLADTILSVYSNPSAIEKVLNEGCRIYNGFRWNLQKEYFINIIKTKI